MNAEERDLIIGLFKRMRDMNAVEKDREAARLIDEEMGRNPDAPYLLTQSVLVQEQALQRAEARIRELEDQIRQFEPSERHTATGGSPGFLRHAPKMPAAETGGASGGFMSQAVSTALGVAGGMLLAQGISSLFDGDDTGKQSATGMSTRASEWDQKPGAGHLEAPARGAETQAASDAGDGDWWDWGDDIEI